MKKEELRRIRHGLGLTQQELSSKIPVALPTYSKWENGHSTPSKMAVIRINQIKNGLE